jgi:hypothetical protein
MTGFWYAVLSLDGLNRVFLEILIVAKSSFVNVNIQMTQFQSSSVL